MTQYEPMTFKEFRAVLHRKGLDKMLEDGRALDDLVAQTLLGWRAPVGGHIGWLIPPGEEHPQNVPAYSRNMSDAWQVVLRITRPPTTQGEAEQAANSRFGYWWEQALLWSCSEAEAARLICEAALEALGKRDWFA